MLKLFKNIFGTKSVGNLSQTEINYKKDNFEQISKLLATSIEKSPDDWERLKQRLSIEFDEQILLARSLNTTPQALEKKRTDSLNAELERKRSIMKKGYSLTKEDHFNIILPIYNKISFFPDPEVVTFSKQKAGDLLYFASSNDYHTSKDAQDNLMGFCDTYAVAQLSKQIRQNYETVRRAKDAGYSKFHLICDRKCCNKCKALDKSEVVVNDLIDKYLSNNLDFPHELPWNDVVDYCLGPYLIVVEF